MAALNFSKTKFVLPMIMFGYLLVTTSVTAATYELEMPLPGMAKTLSDPALYIRQFFIFGLSLIAFMAVAALGLGGIMWMLSGSVTTTAKAKDLILGAFMGLLLLLGSYLLLYTIDPDLTKLSLQTLEIYDISEPPGEADNGLTAGRTADNVGCKETYMCEDLNNGKVSAALVSRLNALPVDVTITETTHNHGCFAGDPCVGGAACSTSDHCSGRGVDIRISDLSPQQRQQVLYALNTDRCTEDLYFAGMPGFCMTAGQPAKNSKACKAHTDHIHYSIKPNCQ